ncbi:MAG: hypothetical protein IPG92_15430 [Flavobacteriales bacterium]|nr:hypothetical protein [Flavobacteriales bacterium]
MKLDQDGTPDFLRAYGDTNQYSSGYGVIPVPGGYALTGATTVMKNSFQDYPDVFLIRTDAQGDTVWARTYHGTNNDGSENASSIVQMYDDVGFTIAVASMSYPTVGFVPNKHVLLRTDANGNMTAVRSYNNGGSHYPYITKPKGDVGVLMSGFTTNYEPGVNNMFKPIVILTDDALNSGCNETDRLAQTVMEIPNLQVRLPAYVVASGGSLVNSTVSGDIVWTDTVLCANILDPCSTNGISAFASDAQFTGDVRYDATQGAIIFSGFDASPWRADLFDVTGRHLASASTMRPLPVPANSATAMYVVLVRSGARQQTFRIAVVPN